MRRDQCLSLGGLDALWGDEPYTRIVQRIERGTPLKSARAQAATQATSDAIEPPLPSRLQIASIKIEEFRRLKTVEAEVGRFHLIQGPNASGKTTFLEAIECMLCGTSRRTGKPNVLEAELRLSSGQTMNSMLTPTECRQMEREWYNSYSRLRSDLARLFGIYNYFDADAATRLELAGSAKEISEAIRALIVGPDLVEMNEKITKIRPLIKDARRRKAAELEALEQRIAELRAKGESLRRLSEEDNLESRKLSQELARLTGTDQLLSISEMYALLPPRPSPFDLPPDAWAHYAQHSVGRVEHELRVARDVRETMERLKAAKMEAAHLRRCRDSLSIVIAGTEREWPRKWEEIDRLKSLIAPARGQVAAIREALPLLSDEESLARLAPTVSNEVIRSYRREAEHLEQQLASSEGATEALVDAAIKVREHIRIGPRENCPVCGAYHGSPEGLLSAIESQIAAAGSIAAETKRRLQDARLRVRLMEGLIALRDALALTNRVPVESVPLVRQAKVFLGQFADHSEHLELLQRDLRASGAPSREEYGEHVAQLTALLGDDRAPEPSTRTQAWGRRLDEMSAQAEMLLSALEGSVAVWQRGRSEAVARTELATVKSIRDSDLAYLSRFAAQESTTLDAVLGWTQSVQRYAARHPSEDARTQATIEAVEGEQHQLRTTLPALEKSVAALDRAMRSIQEIEESLPLDAHVSELFEAHQELISRVFRVIHSPHEFDAVLFVGGEIRLKDRTGEERGLQQISSGQRAALALSTFLAVNLKATNGPALMLLDDPIALVDDLNTVGFIDILRELALTDKRQVFFATANSVIASLIRAKIPPNALSVTFLEHPGL